MNSLDGINSNAMEEEEHALHAIWLRDPFVVVLRENADSYLLFGTTDEPPLGESAYSKYPAAGFHVYESASLVGPWKGPRWAFRRSEGFWSRTQFWAPEITKYGQFWYMTATFGGSQGRSCQILRSVDPRGPFEPFSPPVTPFGWFCLDAHLYFGEAEPRVIFCREWLEVEDGEMYCAKLSGDLSRMIEEPIKLFAASEAKWTRPIGGGHSKFVTDGPFLWRSRATKELIMLWSSIGEGGNYTIGVSRSESGLAEGPWIHDESPVFNLDGGHCMLFRPLADRPCPPLWDGNGVAPLVMALHQPNKDPLKSRANFYLVEERVSQDGKLILSIDESKRIS